MRINLPNNSMCSALSVHPKTWKSARSITCKWYVHYRYYNQDYPKGKLIIVKGGVNYEPDVKERKVLISALLENELTNLLSGYNPISKTRVKTIEESTFTEAMQHALTSRQMSEETRDDVADNMNRFCEAVKNLNLDMPIGEVRRKHIRKVLDHMAATNPRFTNNTFNTYRKYLGILFKELVQLDLVESNPIPDMEKRKVERKEKVVLMPEEREAVDKFLREKHPDFHRFVQIFFHSGSRTRELLRLKCKDVDLPNQRFKIVIRKGKVYRETWKVIKDVALPYWSQLDLSIPDNFVFSKKRKPGPTPIRYDQINKQWARLINQRKWDLYGKKDHEIKATFYSLKHLHSDEAAKLLSIKDAGFINSHTDEDVTLLYAQGEKDRQLERVRKLGNKFA